MINLPPKLHSLSHKKKCYRLVSGKNGVCPRALGNRSILGDARFPEMKDTVNMKIKFRESFRPFAPSVLKEKASEYFDLGTDSPYMLMVADVQGSKRVAEGRDKAEGLAKLSQVRSGIPAVTHVDYSARIQTVSRETMP